MKRFIFALFLILSSFAVQAQTAASPRIFIMLEIDGVVIDTLPFSSAKKSRTIHIDALNKYGYIVQNIAINTKSSKDKKLDNFLKKTKQAPIELDDSNRKKIEETVVIRPHIQNFFQSLYKLGFPVYILICSKSNDPRVKSIVDNLNIEINNIAFKNFAHFIPNKYFTVLVGSQKSPKISVKSAYELRNSYKSEKFGNISPEDYVILIDTIADSQFILSNRQKDLNIKLTPFNIKHLNNYNKDFDELEMSSTLERIKQFISNNDPNK